MYTIISRSKIAHVDIEIIWDWDKYPVQMRFGKKNVRHATSILAKALNIEVIKCASEFRNVLYT